MAKELLRVTLNTANRGDCPGAARQRTRHGMRIESRVVGVVVALGVSGCLEPATCYELLACSDDNRDAGTQTLNLKDGGSLVTRGFDAAHNSNVVLTSSDDGGASADVSRVPDAASPTSVTPDGGANADFVVDAAGDASDTISLDSGFEEPDSGGGGCAEGYRTAGEGCELAPRVEVGGGFYLNGAAGHTCVIARNGDVRCWGDNRSGQCGDAIEEAVADEPGEDPSIVHLATPAVAIALGPEATCALTNDGRVFEWGGPSKGTVREAVVNAKAVGVGVGSGFKCVLLETGEVWCWGDNSYGATGQGSGSGSTEAPARVGGLEFASQLVVGDQHACVLQASGEVRCWGRGLRGALGVETEALMDQPDEVPNPVFLPGPATKVAAGTAVTCAIVDDGSVWCWGSGATAGANGTSADSPLPSKIALTDHALDLALSGVGCAILTNHQVQCWGAPYWHLDQAVSIGNSWQVDLGSDWSSHVSLSPIHMCVTLASDRVRCWGQLGAWGELGVPPEAVVEGPVTTRIVGY